MKKFLNPLLFLTALLALVGCEKDEELTHLEVSPVEALYTPENNQFFNLGAQSTAVFEWQAAKSENSGIVLYDVVFDTEDGDFSDPVYVMPSDGNGMQRMLNLPFGELNKIAEMAGIQSLETGKLKWTVWSSKGLEVKTAVEERSIEVERPGGFPTPDELFLTGTATETGADLGAALPFKKTGATTFEIYTSLVPGEYQLATRNSGEPETYFIDGTKMKAEGTTTFAGEEGVYRLRVDFSDGSAKLVEVVKTELWFAPFGEFLFELPYNSNGTWKAAGEPIEFKQEGWGRDERYKFKFTINDNGETKEEWFGSTNADNQRPTADSSEAYWHMVPVSDDHWQNSFKFATQVDMSTADIEIIFNTSVPEYTHSVTVVE